MEPLLVSHALERKAKIGPFFLPELGALLGACGLLFLGTLLLKPYLAFSRGWLLLSPALFLIVTALLKAWRPDNHPSLLLSWWSFHQQPKCLGPGPPPPCLALKTPPGTQLTLAYE